MYEVLGAVCLSDNEEYSAKLVKEALKRGSIEEKQRYTQMQQQKEAISRRLQEIATAKQALTSQDELNVLPQTPKTSPVPDKNSRTLGLSNLSPPARSRQVEEEYDAKRQQYTTALKTFHAQNSALLAEHLKLMDEYLTLITEYMALEEDEKWLLLAMAIKNQSSLMGYMQSCNEK